MNEGWSEQEQKLWVARHLDMPPGEGEQNSVVDRLWSEWRHRVDDNPKGLIGGAARVDADNWLNRECYRMMGGRC